VWSTHAGPRTIEGPEAGLIRAAIGLVVELIEDDDDWDFGIPIFDNQQPEQKLALLGLVGTALLDRHRQPPPLTAVISATVAVIYGEVETIVASEIEEERLSSAPVRSIRSLLSELRPFQEPVRLAVESTDCEAWNALIRALRDRVLHDRMWLHAEAFLDDDPAVTRRAKRRAGLGEDYFWAIAPDPIGTTLHELRATLQTLVAHAIPSHRPEQTMHKSDD